MPTLSRVFRVWLFLSLQSFGGGAATFVLIRRTAVEREKWITDDDFARYWAICQLTPGINLLALTVLIGRRVRGAAGAAAALIGLLLPASIITIAVTAAYAHVKDWSVVKAAVRGVIPATVGLGVVASIQMMRPPIVASRSEGAVSLSASVVVLIASAVVSVVTNAPIVVVLLACGVALAIVHAVMKRGAL
jgi:chromate transporter